MSAVMIEARPAISRLAATMRIFSDWRESIIAAILLRPLSDAPAATTKAAR
jgi:hypothetical protein